MDGKDGNDKTLPDVAPRPLHGDEPAFVVVKRREVVPEPEPEYVLCDICGGRGSYYAFGSLPVGCSNCGGTGYERV